MTVACVLRSFSIFTIWCYLIASLTFLLLMMPYGLTQHNDNPHIVEPTPALNLLEKALTTVLLVNNEASDSYRRFHTLRPEVGLLTSTARTFIQNGVTTEYATQVVGTTLDNGRVYAQYLKKSSRVLYENDPFPSVVTSWVGDSTILPQSHNDLYNADRPDWQDQDDRLRKAFVGNIDFVGELSEKTRVKSSISPTVTVSPIVQKSSQLPSLKTYEFNDISRNSELENNLKKLVAQKVLPIADLPTYTVKNNFSPSGFSWDDSDEKSKNKLSFKTALEARTPKLYYKQIMSEQGIAPMEPQIKVPDFLQKRKLATTTYYGFADFTTIVGDSVIVFSPSSSMQQANLGQVTSIKGEATLGEFSPPQVSYVPITVTEDFIMPTSLQENQMTTSLKSIEDTLMESYLTLSSIQESVIESYSTTIPEIVNSDENKSLSDVLEMKESQIVEENTKDNMISISSNSVFQSSVTLSRPSDEEISAIFSMLQKNDKNSVVKKDTDIIVATSTIDQSPLTLIEPSSTVPTQAGATTIFFEEDPFANFVDPTSSLANEIIADNIESSQQKATDALPSNLTLFSITNSNDIIMPSIEESSVLQSIYSVVRSTESILKEKTPSLRPVTTLKSGIVIKEILNTDPELLEECLRTSQVFLTQLPKIVTYFTTYFTSVELAESSSIESNIVNTFDILETTKNYCIQSTSTSLSKPEVFETQKPFEEVTKNISNASEEIKSENDSQFESTTEEQEEYDTTTFSNSEVDFSSGDESIDEEEEDDSGEEFELIFKTLYTTYTYLTTIFQESTSNILSHTEVITNVVTSTVGAIEEPSLIESLKTDITPTTTASFENKFTALNNLDNIIREEDESFEQKDNSNDSLLITPTEQLEDFQLNTFQTTYTYFTTIFAEGETEILSRTEVLTNIVTVKPTKSYVTENNTYDASSVIQASKTDELIEEESSTTNPLHTYSTMIRNGSVPVSLETDLEKFSSITLVTDVRSSSSSGEGHVISDILLRPNNYSLQQEQFIDDQISSESNTDEIVPSATLLLQTSFTTFTYYTTMYNNNNTNIISRLETITNVVTETLSPSAKQSSPIEEASLPVTYFTTFTYWTKLAKDGIISTLSREETITNIIEPTSVNIENAKATELVISALNTTDPNPLNIDASSSVAVPIIEKTILEPTTYYTTYTYYTTSYEADNTITNSRFETLTNVVTPTVPLSSEQASLTTSSIILDHVDSKKDDFSPKKEILLFDYKKIIDADGISTLFFETEVSPSINENGDAIEVTRSSSSLYIDEIKKTDIPSSTLSLTVNAEGSTVPVRQYKTGLVRLIEGTRIGNHTTTLYQSRVIGTLIENRYAQIIESTSSFLFEKVPSSSYTNVIPSKTENYILEATNINSLNPSVGVLESSAGDSTDTDTYEQPSENDENGKPDEEDEDEDDENNNARLPFQSKKRKFTPVIRPFASRNRPQFAPKKKGGLPSSATIITRSDFTPTITVTPALKSNGRFSSSRKNIGSSLNNAFGSSSRRFSRPGKSSVGVNQITSTGYGTLNSNSFGGGGGSGRNRFGVSSRNSPSLGGSTRRLGSLSRSSQPGSAGFRSGFSSGGFNSNARFRIKPTAAFAFGQSNNPTDLLTTPPSSDLEDGDEENSTQGSVNDEESETTTENLRRNQNPLLRFRRPLTRPNESTAAASIQRGTANSNNFVSARRNPLTGRSKGSTSTTTTTTTPKSRPRGFQRPTIAALSGRQRPQSSLFPPRGLFQIQKQDEASLSKNSEPESSTTENPDGDDDVEYDEEEDESEGDNSERKRRSSAKASKNKIEKFVVQALPVNKRGKRSKREADVSYPSRSNFRSRFRQPKTISSSAAAEERKAQDEVETVEKSTQQPATRHGRTNSRFGAKQKHRSSLTSTTAVTVSHRAIRPTRPNNGRSQFTLREKDTTTTTKSYTRHNAASSFRRPQPTSSPRRTSTSISNNRRIKAFANNNIGTETSQRSTNIGTRTRANNLNSGRSRSTSTRARNRNEFNMDLVTNSFDGTITVTHVFPSEVTIPVVNGQLTEYKNVITAKTSTEILNPQQYTTFTGSNGQTTLALTREESMTNIAGATEITQFILHGSPTTMITFTPTTIRGRKTSFSHIVPSTAYSVEKLVSTMQPQLSNAPLANILLSQLLLGNIGLPGQAPGNPLLGALSQPLVTTQAQLSPVTDYRTHTSTYVTTIFEDFHAFQSRRSHKLLQNSPHKETIKNLGKKTNSQYGDYNIVPTPLSKLTSFDESFNYAQNKMYIASGNSTSNKDNLEEARYNLATRIMSNGVEVIIAGEKTKSIDSNPSHSTSYNVEFQTTDHQIHKPMTLAPSTLKNQMILVVPNNFKDNMTIPINTNQFVTKTCLTTYTYRTTYLQSGITTIESREKVITNIATEERNYPKITSTLSMGVTLARTPQLAVGVFPTTYSYFYTLNDGITSKVMTSDHTVLNTITAPDDYIIFLQPSEAATPVYDTNTYFNKVIISKTYDEAGILKVMTNSETLTQIIVTESLPPRSTSVLTSYYAFDIDETLTQALSTKFIPSLHKSEVPNKTNNDMHIYATKTFLTTFTYLTTTTLFQSFTPTGAESEIEIESHDSKTEILLPIFTTAINYHTKVVENVITEAVPTNLLNPNLITQFRKELKNDKNQRSAIVTLATLLGGQTLQITAMKIMNPKTAISSHLSHSTKIEKVSNSIQSSNLSVEPEESVEYINNSPKLNDSTSITSSAEDSTFESSELSTTAIEAGPDKGSNNLTGLINSQLSAGSINNIFGSLNLNGFTVLRPVISAMADLIQSKFVSNNDFLQSKNAIKNISAKTKYENIHENPIYIPVQNSLEQSNKNYSLYEKAEGAQIKEDNDFNFVRLTPPQSLHIQPPEADLTITDDNWMHDKYISNKRNNLNPKNNEQPLINGGIPIRPGEIITANSDVIVGKPNGIQQPKVYTLQSNLMPLRRDKINEEAPSPFVAMPKKVVFYEQNNQDSHKYTTIIPIKSYDNILKPPPPPPPSQLKFLNTIRQRPLPPIINNLSSPTAVREPNIESIIHHKYYPKINNLNHEMSNNEIIEIKHMPQISTTDITSKSKINMNRITTNLLPPYQNQFQLRFNSQYPNSSFEDSKTYKLNYQNEKFTTTPITQNVRMHSNHQRINMQTDVLNHNIAMTVPPLTFKKESEHATPVLHGIPSNSNRLIMPHVKIPLNEVEVQVNLTPQHNIYQNLRFHDLNFLSNRGKLPAYGAFTIESDEASSNILSRPYEHSDAGQIYQNEQRKVQSSSTNNYDKKSSFNVRTKHIDPNTVFNSYHAIKPTVSLSNNWNMSWSKQKINPDQLGAFSSVDINLTLSQDSSKSNGLNQSNSPDQVFGSKKLPFPLLSPLTALQVNHLDETPSHFPVFQSIKKKISNISIPKKIRNSNNINNTRERGELNTAKQKFTSLSPTRISFTSLTSSMNPERILLTTSTPTPLPNIKHNTEHSKIKNHSSSEQRERQRNSFQYYQNYQNKTSFSIPNLPFSHGKPFTQFLPVTDITTKQVTSNQYDKSHSYNNLFISAGEAFKSKHQNPTYQNRNISTQSTLKQKVQKANITPKSDDSHHQLPVMSTKVYESNPINLKPESNHRKQITFTTRRAEIHKHTKNPPITLNLYTDNQYSSKPPTNPPKNILNSNTENQKKSKLGSHLSSTIQVLGLYPPPPFSSTVRSLSNQYATIKNAYSTSTSVKSLPTHIVSSAKPYLELNNNKALSDTNFSRISSINGNKPNWKLSTSAEEKNLNNHIKVTPFAVSSSTHFSNHMMATKLNLPEIPEPVSSFSSIESSISQTIIEDLDLRTDKYYNIVSKNHFEIILEPSVDLSNPSIILFNENSSFSLNPDSKKSTLPLENLMQLTKFITNTVTTSKTAISTTTITNEQEKIQSNFKTTTMIHVTTTFTTFIMDTVTQTETLIEPTRISTIPNTATKSTFENSNDFIMSDYKENISTETNKESSVIVENAISKKTNDIEIKVEKQNQSTYENPNKKTLGTDRDNIFVVMTKTQGNPNIIKIPLDTTNTLQVFDQDYSENLNLDLATRDEELFMDSDDRANNILLGGVLIASSNSSILGSTNKDECRPACRTSKNELCKKSESRYQCACRPGFARMFPDRPCRPTYTYTMRILIKRIGNILLEYNDSLSDNSTKEFQELATMTHDAVDRMVMQSDFRDIYHGVSIESFSMDKSNSAPTANILLQFSDMNDEKRLEDVFKKYLRVNGYNVGLTELFTDKRGVEMLTIVDFNECNYTNFHDCSRNARCFNLRGTYTCSCDDGYIDLSENSMFPGRLCSAEVIGCERCNYHGQCVPISRKGMDEKIVVCECFSWYSGSLCQVNLKILLIILMAIGTILFVILLICISLMCIKIRRPRKLSLSQVFPDVQDTMSKQVRGNKTTSFLKNIKSDKRAMIMDTSSESSDSSLPYILKESIRSERKDFNKLAIHNKSEQNDCLRVIKEPFKEISLKNQLKTNNANYCINAGTTSSVLPTFGNFQRSVVTEIEQSDRSLTVMIPRAKYHPSVLPPTKLLHHQLTLERTNTEMPNHKFETQTESDEVERSNALRAEISSSGALVSAGFEVSAMVNENVLYSNNENPKAMENSCIFNTSDDSVQNSRERCQHDITKVNELNVNNENGCHILNYTVNKSNDSCDEMDEWFDNMQQTQSSTEGQSFNDLMVQLTECDKTEQNNRTIYTSEEANTMAERDIGSTFLLPHTHLYKPERESDVSGLDSI